MKDFIIIGDLLKPLIKNLAKVSGKDIPDGLSYDLEVLFEKLIDIKKEKIGATNEN